MISVLRSALNSDLPERSRRVNEELLSALSASA